MKSPALVAVALLTVAGCSGGDDDVATTDSVLPVDTAYYVPAAAAQTPFCAAMSEISLRLNTDAPEDLNAFLITEYEQLLPEVPSVIASEFQSVLNDLRAGSGSVSDITTSVPAASNAVDVEGFPEEGYLPDVEPALRLNTYLAANCFGTQSNPGPPATAPFSEPPVTEPN